MHGVYGWHMGGMWIWWILLVIVVGAMIWFALNRTTGAKQDAGESPEQTLKRRYAKGEIDRQTYEEMISELRR